MTMDSMMDKDLAAIFRGQPSREQVTILTGSLAGQVVQSLFTTNYLMRALDGHEIGTKGHVVTFLSKDVDGLTDDDAVSYRGERFEIARIMSDYQGMTRVELSEELDGVSHGEL